MEVTVRAHHVEITPPLKDYAQQKLGKLGKFFENIQQITVELDVSDTSEDAKRQVAKGNIMASHASIRAEHASKDMYASIDLLYEKMETQLRKHKEKLKDHKNKTKLSNSLNGDEKKTRSGKTVHFSADADMERRYVPKPMEAEEAAEHMELEGLNFLVFRNADNEEVNVVYKLKNGKYAVIEP